jgi:hypothetical protein|nr:MAG TPA: hypothetical protein [Caudoviricetes sp.]
MKIKGIEVERPKELKELNPRFVDRKEFKIVSPSGNILKIWNRR